MYHTLISFSENCHFRMLLTIVRLNALNYLNIADIYIY